MTEKQLLLKREKMIEKAGGGPWVNRKTGDAHFVDVTFYPKTKLWITVKGERKPISKLKLQRDYQRIEL